MEPKFIIDVSDKKTRKLFENQLTKRGFISYFPKLIDWKLQNASYLKGDFCVGITTNINIKTDKGRYMIWDVPVSPSVKFQLINHFPNPEVLTNKARLTETLTSRVENYKSFYPETYILKNNNEKDLENFISKFSKDSKGSKDMWIVKPSNLRQGLDIKIHDSLDSITNFILENEKDNTKTDEYVVQKYIKHPLLYQGRKFDVRIHVLLDEHMNIYIYPLTLCRTVGRKYTPELTGNWREDKYVHITNHSLQKYDKLYYSKYEKSNIILLKDMKIEGLNLYENFIPIWSSIIKKILKSSEDLLLKNLPINNKKHFYELFGFDFIIDDNLKTWLLEINLNPGLDYDSKDIDIQMDKLINDLFNIVLDPLNGIKTRKYNSWIKI